MRSIFNIASNAYNAVSSAIDNTVERILPDGFLKNVWRGASLRPFNPVGFTTATTAIFGAIAADYALHGSVLNLNFALIALFTAYGASNMAANGRNNRWGGPRF